MNESNDDSRKILPPKNTDKAIRLLQEVRDINKERRSEVTEAIVGTEKFDGDTPIDIFDTDSWTNAVADQDAIPRSLGRFQIVRQLGYGGFARVFLALDPKLGRKVALKVPNLAAMVSPDARERFAREAHAAGILSHPAIVPVFESGNVGPVSFIAYEYCPGQTLAQWLADRDNRIAHVTAARIVATLADAVEHAHQRGIIHRDLKPANVLIEENDGLENQRIRITDFGLARQTEVNDKTVTSDGAIIGTPAYMSPEQARGSQQIGKPTDIFSMGIIFYELLTGTLPFRCDNHLSTLQAVDKDSPKAPRRHVPTIPADLEAVCLKCIEKEPERRYASAFELAEDLRAWLDGRSVTARRPTALEKFTRWCRHNPALAAVSMFALFALAAGLAGTTWQWLNAVEHASIATRAKEQAIVARNEAVASRNHAVGAQRIADEAKEVAIKEKQRAESAHLDSETFTDFLVNGVMSASKPVGVQGGMGADVTVRQMLIEMEAVLESKMADRPTVEAKARNAFGGIWRSLGEYEKAADHFTRVLELKGDGEVDEQILQSTLEIGSILWRKGELSTAMNLLQTSFPKVRQLLGDNHFLTTSYLNTMAAINLRQNRYAAAIEQLAELRSNYLEDFGPEHAVTHASTLNLAVAYREAGDDDRAIELLQEQLTQLMQSNGIRNAQTLRTMMELAETLNFAGRAAEGKRLLEQALPIARKVFGPRNPKTILMMLYLARNHRLLGDMPAAVTLCQTARELSVKQFKEYHPVTNQCILLLSQLYEGDGDAAGHAKVINELIQLHRENGNAESELQRVPSLAKALFNLEKYADVEQLIEQYREKMVERFGVGNQTPRDLSYYWALSLQAMGKWQLAADEFSALVKQLRSTMIENNAAKSILASYLAGQANCLNELSHFEEAVAVANECLEIREETGSGADLLAEAHSILADSRIGQGEVDSASERIVDAHQTISMSHDKNRDFQSRRRMQQSLRRMIRLYQRLKQPEQVRSFEQQLSRL